MWKLVKNWNWPYLPVTVIYFNDTDSWPILTYTLSPTSHVHASRRLVSRRVCTGHKVKGTLHTHTLSKFRRPDLRTSDSCRAEMAAIIYSSYDPDFYGLSRQRPCACLDINATWSGSSHGSMQFVTKYIHWHLIPGHMDRASSMDYVGHFMPLTNMGFKRKV